MSSKKKRKEKQQELAYRDTVRNLDKIVKKNNLTPFQLETWMGHGNVHKEFYKVTDVYDALDWDHDVIDVEYSGRAIGCPSEITIKGFSKDKIVYELDGQQRVGNVSDYLISFD